MTGEQRMWITIAAILAAVLIALFGAGFAHEASELDCRKATIAAGARPAEARDACR